MNTYELILKRRSVRKFAQEEIKKDDLAACVNAARVAPSGSNLQPLEFIVVTDGLGRIFPHTRWARYLPDGAPKKGEEPTAYIVVLTNTKIAKAGTWDVGYAVENILLTALERGIASCVVANLDRAELAKNLGVPEGYFIELVVALGYPAQACVEEEYNGDMKYWLDEKGVLHVPKRKLQDVLHEEKF